MTEKQKYLLKLFREVDEICREHNLRYVLAGGSLIGALRHEGFVPWDDDVDLYMPRPDWEKFIEICKTELPPDREIQCSEVDRNYTNSFPRYASTNTCAIHKSQIIGKDCGGEIIDILTLDPVPADDKEYEKYRTHMMIYSDLINISVGYSDRWEIPASMQRIILICIKIILQKFQLSSEHLIQIFCLLRIPEHIVISPKQNLPARQSHNKIQIRLTLCKISPPGMISGNHYCIILCHFSLPVFLDLNHIN